jgi:peptidyl-prolyl cis-trans isomerase A (cyclophilin A)
VAQTPAQSQKPSTASHPATTGAKKPATAAHSYDRALLHPTLLKDKAPAEYKVKFVTTRGDFTVSVTRAWAPLGADRFYNLVKHHFYDNASFFRVHAGFVVQWGISAYPAVTAAWQHADVKDDPVTQSNKRAYITFATSGKDSRTTQVFINFADTNSRLDSMGFAPFGLVTDGMNNVEMLYDVYGESRSGGGTGPEQDQIEKFGKPYLDKGWPKLDYIKTTELTPPPAATPAHKAPSPAKKPQ